MEYSDFEVRMKEYEQAEAGRKLIKLLPVCARLDGRCFHKFTKDFYRPFDSHFSESMIETTKYLVDKTNAKIGYTQSDEISLVYLAESYAGEIFFNGKIQKLTSILASMCSAYFNMFISQYIELSYKSGLPIFDCRVWNVPNKTEAANVLLWRELDATKNAISMAAHCYYSHNELMYKNGSEMQEMLFQKGINFNNYPNFFKRGTFVQRKVFKRKLTEEELSKIPEPNRTKVKDQLVHRSKIITLDMPIFSTITNREKVIFNASKPRVIKNEEVTA